MRVCRRRAREAEVGGENVQFEERGHLVDRMDIVVKGVETKEPPEKERRLKTGEAV